MTDDDLVNLLTSKTPLARLSHIEVHSVLQFLDNLGFTRPAIGVTAAPAPAVDVPPAPVPTAVIPAAPAAPVVPPPVPAA
ncbi:hypothetical protein [Bradyrhizobium pachyrhizi]|uniref:hypothetical protein n=1 Tax=Bradyrhizobium pachyrhizi TaxID=280333 RepID=UPI0007055894|nr:hypothetical protein [Bradyrhizobium pachyrhizi]